jgi:prepilin-type N-terminal cleavage/methylation domain-containing protein
MPDVSSRSLSVRAAFTLVEIMVVVVVIGLLAAIAIPAFQRVREKSIASRYVNDFRQFDSAFQRYATENGSWPAAGALGAVPAGMNGYLPTSFTSTSPMGGNYQWSGPSSFVVLRGSQATDSIMQQVDTLLDDGDLASGEFLKIAGVGYGLHMR